MTANERTGWRDLEFSERHRNKYGFNCPAVDIDFLMIEYNYSKPVALVEYKHCRALNSNPPININHPSFKALRQLADDTDIYCILAFYWPDDWKFKIEPINEKSILFYADEYGFYEQNDCYFLTEQQFVSSLYKMRETEISKQILSKLNNKTFE